jgi:hypothetical protein
MSEDSKPENVLELPQGTKGGKVVRGVLNTVSAALPIAGGLLSAAASAWSEREQNRINEFLHSLATDACGGSKRAAAEQSELHTPALGGEFDGVIDQIGDGLKQKIAVSVYCWLICSFDLQRETLVLGNRVVEIPYLARMCHPSDSLLAGANSLHKFEFSFGIMHGCLPLPGRYPPPSLEVHNSV